MLETSQKIAVIDIETTGPNFDKGDKIIQIGAVIYQNHQIIHEYDMLINPHQAIPTNIQHLTGISEAMVCDAPSFESVASLWYERLKDCIFIAHNLNFDYQCLQFAFNECGIDYSAVAIDTVVLSKILLYRSPGFNLFELSNYIGYPLEDAHNALADAKATINLVNYLVRKAKALSFNKVEKVFRLCQNLPYETALFFKEWALFEVQTGVLANDPSLIFTSEKQDQVINNLALNIIEEMDKRQRILIEDPNPVSNFDLMFKTGKNSRLAGSKLFISLTSNFDCIKMNRQYSNLFSDKKILKVQNAEGFIHKSGFEKLLQEYDTYQLNQTELVILASNYLWMSETETGNFDEINQELISKSMIEKYSLINYQEDNQYYQQMISNIEEADILIGSHLQFLIHQDFLLKDVKNARETVLMIDNLLNFYNALRYFFQISLPVSKIFIEYRHLLEGISILNQDQQTIAQIQAVLDLTEELLNLLEQLLSRSSQIMTNKQEKRTLFLSKTQEDKQYLWKVIEDWVKALDHSVNNLKTNHPQLYSKTMRKIDREIKAIRNNQSENFVFMTANVINGYFFHFELIQQRMKFDLSKSNLFALFDRVLIFEGEDYYSTSKIGYNKLIDLGKFSLVRLPVIAHNTKILARVPLEYCISAGKEKDGLIIADLLEDKRFHFDSKIIIIINNLSFGESLFYSLKERADIYGEYVLLFQGITGSINKNYRRFIESEKAVLIISHSQFSQFPLTNLKFSVNLILTSLPFNSPEKPIMKAIGELLAREEAPVFESLLLPKMISDLKRVLTSFSEFYTFNEMIILDERVFSKSYSQTFRENVKDMIEFESE